MELPRTALGKSHGTGGPSSRSGHLPWHSHQTSQETWLSAGIYSQIGARDGSTMSQNGFKAFDGAAHNTDDFYTEEDLAELLGLSFDNVYHVPTRGELITIDRIDVRGARKVRGRGYRCRTTEDELVSRATVVLRHIPVFPCGEGFLEADEEAAEEDSFSEEELREFLDTLDRRYLVHNARDNIYVLHGE